MSNAADRTRYLRIACALGGLAVVAGAFGAHGLKSRIDAVHLGYWHTAAQYQMYHALAMLAFAAGAMSGAAGRAGVWACRAWIAGVAIFSGTLYVMAVTDLRWLGAITPIGGVALIAGWGLAAISVGSRGGER